MKHKPSRFGEVWTSGDELHHCTDLVLIRLRPKRFRLSPERSELLCAENLDAVLELAADGKVIATTPTDYETGTCNGDFISSSWLLIAVFLTDALFSCRLPSLLLLRVDLFFNRCPVGLFGTSQGC